jgi:predicted Zn finger-like uncharacterized protein
VQSSCPQCGQRIAIDDAKVPDRPFNVKCPKCQSVVRLAGKGAPAPAPAESPATPPPPPSLPPPEPPAATGAAPSGPSPAADEAHEQIAAQVRREIGGTAAAGERALVSLPDRSLAAAVGQMLGRLGYTVDTSVEGDETARAIDQGVYAVVATARVAAAPGKGETLYQRITRMNAETRRRLFVIVVGDEFKSADGNQAYTVVADLVLHSRDAGGAEHAVRSTLLERRRLYKAFLDARQRFEASAG